MRSIVFDFYIVVLFPLLGISIVSLWNSIRLYRTTVWCKEPEKVAKLAKRLIWISASAAAFLVALVFINDGIKIVVICGLWYVLSVAAFVSIYFPLKSSWEHAQKRDWLSLAISIVAILLATASTVYFIHQGINTRHIVCPNCSESQE
jgi:fatty acid desaturase